MSESEINRTAQQFSRPYKYQPISKKLKIMDLQAVRSLLCEDHAHNLPPRVKTIVWFLGKRCNYDCSYCSPHVHDAVSPFIDKKQAFDFIDKIEKYGLKNSFQFKWSFTGGEPFLDPSFLPMLHKLSQSSTTYQVNSITNGSLPIETYRQAAKVSKGITFSLHFERPESEISSIVAKIIQLAKEGDTFIHVNTMMLPGQLQQIKPIIQQFQQHSVNFAVRKISPPESSEGLMPYQSDGPGKKDKKLLDTVQQSENKIIWRAKNDTARYHNTQSYYSSEEHDFLAEINQSVSWQNMGVWTKDDYKEINAEILISQQINSFKDWICFAGVDNIYVDFDGTIFAAQCQNQGPIGHVNDEKIFSDDPVTCKVQWCSCNLDIPIRKAKNLKNLGLIGG